MKRTVQILLFALLITKIVLGGFFFLHWHPLSVSMKNEAVASEKNPMPGDAAAPDPTSRESTERQAALSGEQRSERKGKEQALAAQRASLEKLQASLDRRIETLRRLRDEIRAEQEKKNQVEAAKLKHLIKAYSAMKPKDAAGLFEKMDTDFAVKVFSGMKGEAVGQILSHITVEKAAEISRGLLENP